MTQLLVVWHNVYLATQEGGFRGNMQYPPLEPEQQQRGPSQRSVYIKNGGFLGVIAYLIEGRHLPNDGRSLRKVAELAFRQRRTESGSSR